MESEISWKAVVLVLVTVVVASALAWIFRVETAVHPAVDPAPRAVSVEPAPTPTRVPPTWQSVGAEIAEVMCSYAFAEDQPHTAFDGVISYDATPPRNRWATWDSGYARDWIAWRFSDERTLGELTVHFFDDGMGTRVPAGYRLEVLSGEEWVEVPTTARDPEDPTPGRPNRLVFDPVTGTTFRLVLDHLEGYSSGITEFEFPPAEGATAQ
jgi:hypothetical protein